MEGELLCKAAGKKYLWGILGSPFRERERGRLSHDRARWICGVGIGTPPSFRKLPNLLDEEMENQLQIHKIHFSSPDPSVEALLHAFARVFPLY